MLSDIETKTFLSPYFSLSEPRYPFSNLLTDMHCARRVVIRQYDDRVTATRIHLQRCVDSGRATRNADAALRHSPGLISAEQFVVPQRDSEFQQVFSGRISSARRTAARGF